MSNSKTQAKEKKEKLGLLERYRENTSNYDSSVVKSETGDLLG